MENVHRKAFRRGIKLKPLAGIVGTIYDLQTPFTREVELVNQKNTDFKTERVLYSAENTLSYFQKAGFHACMISPHEDQSIIDRLDMIVIPGGPDVNPNLYEQVPHPETFFEKDGARDHFEKGIIELAIEKGKPIFAICRGLQLVNVVLGGTLHQHLPDWSTEVPHRSIEGPAAYVHKVRTAGWLKETVGEELSVNSWHHQGIDVLAPALTPLAWSPEGLIEAFEAKPDVAPIFGVQWHPEILQDKKSIDLLAVSLERMISNFKIGGDEHVKSRL
ncbi:glutamine amidotransferase [Bacillus freudenreichii]|nr:glutamine amidotransferase [Bacillus freudenreichii]